MSLIPCCCKLCLLFACITVGCNLSVCAHSDSDVKRNSSFFIEQLFLDFNGNPNNTFPVSKLSEVYEKIGILESTSKKNHHVHGHGERDHSHDHKHDDQTTKKDHEHEHDHTIHDHPHDNDHHHQKHEDYSDHKHDKHHHHEHHKRLFKRHAAQNNNCIMPEDLVKIYGFDSTSLTKSQFEAISPGLIYLSTIKACQTFQSEHEHETPETPGIVSVWLYSIGANVLITLVSLIGVLLIPIVNKKASAKTGDLVMCFFFTLGAGVLISDALLHLLPEAFGLHSHGHDELTGHDHEHDMSFLWISTCVVFATYLFCCIDFLLRTKFHSNDDSGDDEPVSVNPCKHHHHHHNEGGDVKKEQDGIFTSLKKADPIAVLVLIGDSFHNFVDGAAIASSFASSIKLGICTSLAVLLHEIPHELGDFAILLKSGLSPMRAMYFSMLANLPAFIGMIVGIILTQTPAFQDSRKWILAFAAGSFLYISLVGILPNLHKVIGKKNDKSKILVAFSGLIVGWLTMVMIALYGEDIQL